MRLRISFCILFLAFQLLYATRYALIVGQNSGGSTVDQLHFAETDARHCSDLLVNYASFVPDNIITVLHPDSAVFSNALSAISEKIARSGGNDSALFLFYYSGHADGNGLLLDSTQFNFSDLKTKLEAVSAAMKIAIFDACQSGTLVAFKGGKRAAPFFNSILSKTRGMVWIASSSSNEQAQESETLKSSLFSYHFFSGIRGSADISGDKKVSLNEAYQYAYKKTIETSTLTSGIVQHPVYRFDISGEGDIVISDLNEKTSGITVARDCKGSFLIMSRDYSEVFADFRKSESREIFIALAPGEYTIINAENGSRIGLYQFTASNAGKVFCDQTKFHQSLVEQMREKGRSALTHKENGSSSVDSARMTVAGMFVSVIALVLLLTYVVHGK